MAELSMLTSAGAEKLAVASPESPVRIAYLAVGDGGGGYPELRPTWTALAREVWRGAASEPVRGPDNARMLMFEAVIPANVGGFFIREMGLFDDDGDLIAVSQCSPVEKPSAASSAKVTLTAVFRLLLDTAAQTNLVINDQPYIDHQALSNRSAQDAHPMSSISGLLDAIKQATTTELGRLRLATQQEVDAGILDDVALTPKTAAARYMSAYQVIPAGANLDNYTTQGFYAQPSKADAQAGGGYPIAEVGFLVVQRQGSTMQQTYFVATTGDMYTRGNPNGVTWGVWRRCLHSAELATAADMTAGTDAGKLATAKGVADSTRVNPTQSTRGMPMVASNSTADGGTDDIFMMTAHKVLRLIRATASAATESARGTLIVATQAQVGAGTLDNVVVTPKKLRDGGFWPIGMGQAWQDVTASRASDVTYTNSTGRPIAVAVRSSSTPNQAGVYFYINGALIYGSEADMIAGHAGGMIIVPPGASYSCGASPDISRWMELR